jgi:hypothetical protein
MFAQLIISSRQQADSIKITRRGLTDARPPAPSAAPIVIMPLLRSTTSYRSASSRRTLLSALLLLLLAARVSQLFIFGQGSKCDGATFADWTHCMDESSESHISKYIPYLASSHENINAEI